MKVEIKDVFISFDNKVLFDKYNLIVETGQKIWISAPSGSGKSTLLKMIAGFIKPDNGNIIVGGEVLNGTSVHQIRSNIGFINQNADLPLGSVQDILKEIFSYQYNRGIVASHKDIFNVFGKLNLNHDVFKKNVADLSGGEKQRLAFAILMMLKRKVWLLDEITSGLDSENREIIAGFIKQSEATVMLTSHDDYWENTELIKHTINNGTGN